MVCVCGVRACVRACVHHRVRFVQVCALYVNTHICMDTLVQTLTHKTYTCAIHRSVFLHACFVYCSIPHVWKEPNLTCFVLGLKMILY